ncbi:MAG: J domain-containing protein [Deltaproteobacteria bacterium]|nr:J domain-containing protein [Deltaproteobacteria bacterium]
MNNYVITNHYAVLGVLPTASTDEIKSSYRQLAKRYHPDMKAGNAIQFKRIQDAYEILGDEAKRRQFDEDWKAHNERMRAAAQARLRAQKIREARQNNPGQPVAPEIKPEKNAPVPMLTRIMSIAVPRSGQFQLQGLIGNIFVEQTTPENLWETTLRKFDGQDPTRLMNHVIQIKLSGERELVRTILPRPTDFGVEIHQEESGRPGGFRSMLSNLFGSNGLGGLFSGKGFGLYGAHLPLTLRVTIPTGITLNLKDITGSISLGNLDNNMIANLMGGNLQALSLRKARLTLKGSSQAVIRNIRGTVDLMGFGESRVLLDGNIPTLRAVLENQALAEVHAPVGVLQAEVRGNSVLAINNTVENAQCDVRGQGALRIKQVTSSIKGTRGRGARVETQFSRTGTEKT